MIRHRFRVPRAVAALVAAALGTTAALGQAHAEPTSWLSVGTGVAGERNKVTGREVVPVFTAAVGIGTDPNGKFSVGGLFRSTTYFGIGTEIALGPRISTAGFNRGSFGFAFDLGVALRPFGRSDYGRVPLQGGVVVGFPWGVQIETGLRLLDVSGQPSALGAYATVGIDLLRFSAMRRGSTEKAWPNPTAIGAPPAPVKPIPGEDGPDDTESRTAEPGPLAPRAPLPEREDHGQQNVGPRPDKVEPTDTSPPPTLR